MRSKENKRRKKQSIKRIEVVEEGGEYNNKTKRK
jgi:hypothetical protein